MATEHKTPKEEKKDPSQEFYDKAERALRALFDKAKAAHELHFAMALMPEMRGLQDAGWNTAEEAVHAYDQYSALLEKLGKKDIVRLRVILAFYLHAAECSGFYEIPKKMLLTTEGKGNNFMPFHKLVKKHRKTGQAIAPNANTIMKELMGHSWLAGFRELSEVFENTFDPDVRNAIAHADYTLASNGMRLRKRNGGQVRIVPWEEFDALISKGINLFSIIRRLTSEYVQTYHPPKTIQSRMNEHEPVTDFTIYYDPKPRAFGFTTGKEPPKGNTLTYPALRSQEFTQRQRALA
jgi:hypothetical protein